MLFDDPRVWLGEQNKAEPRGGRNSRSRDTVRNTRQVNICEVLVPFEILQRVGFKIKNAAFEHCGKQNNPRRSWTDFPHFLGAH